MNVSNDCNSEASAFCCGPTAAELWSKTKVDGAKVFLHQPPGSGPQICRPQHRQAKVSSTDHSAQQCPNFPNSQTKIRI